MIEFYIHTKIDDLNERRALVRMGRDLQRVLVNKSDTYYLIANINPDSISAWRDLELTQLDGILIGPDGITLLEIKACPDPFNGSDLKGEWPIIKNGRPIGKRVMAGNSVNPYKQARYARFQWMNELLAPSFSQIAELDRPEPPLWGQLSSCVLFSPYLHPKAQIPHLGRDDRWLTFTGVDQINDFVFAARSKLKLSEMERYRLVTEVIKARPWIELQEVLTARLGYLYYETETSGQMMMKGVLRHDEISIGRSRENTIKIPDVEKFRHVSRKHLRIETGRDFVRLFDLGATHRTIVDGRVIPSGEWTVLKGGEEILMGGNGDGNCRVFYTRTNQKSMKINTTNLTGLH